MLLFAAVIGLFAAFALLADEARLIYRQTELSLEQERRNQSKQNAVSFTRVALTPHPNPYIQIIQSTKDVRAVASFQNSVFAATGGGLLQFSQDGRFLRHFTVQDGLPESDLTALGVFRSRLYIGTRSSGLVDFDGRAFAALRLEKHETKSINALYANAQTLLIGTSGGGLLEYNGGRMSEIKAADARLENVVFLGERDSVLLAGTFANGLFVRRNQIWKQLTTAHGLHSNRVTGAEISGGMLFAATDLGVSQIMLDEIFGKQETFLRQSFGLPALTGFVLAGDRFFLTSDDGEVFAFSVKDGDSAPAGFRPINWKKPAALISVGIFRTGVDLWLFGRGGVWKMENRYSEDISPIPFSAYFDENQLIDNNVSALLVDRAERLWAGTFRDGIDVFSADGKKLRHIESEDVREINALVRTRDDRRVLAATTSGALLFDEDFANRDFVAGAELPDRSVTHLAVSGDEKTSLSAISTVKGLYLGDDRSRRLFSTVNGLPSASVFATLFTRNALFVGTMNGLAEIENGKVRRTFKTSNSELNHNWITALCAAGERIFIGTYGGGLAELLPSGDIRVFELETGRFVVNPNALYSDGERLYAGTLDGVRVLDLKTQKWTQIRDSLPASTVLSVTGGRRSIYFGTTGGIARFDKIYWTQN